MIIKQAYSQILAMLQEMQYINQDTGPLGQLYWTQKFDNLVVTKMYGK